MNDEWVVDIRQMIAAAYEDTGTSKAWRDQIINDELKDVAAKQGVDYSQCQLADKGKRPRKSPPLSNYFIAYAF